MNTYKLAYKDARLFSLPSVQAEYVQKYFGLQPTFPDLQRCKKKKKTVLTWTVRGTPSTVTDNRAEAKFHSPVTLSFFPSTSTCCDTKGNCYHKTRQETDLKFITAYKGAAILKQMVSKQPVMFTASATKDKV